MTRIEAVPEFQDNGVMLLAAGRYTEAGQKYKHASKGAIHSWQQSG
jgi:hypothetical protein